MVIKSPAVLYLGGLFSYRRVATLKKSGTGALGHVKESLAFLKPSSPGRTHSSLSPSAAASVLVDRCHLRPQRSFGHACRLIAFRGAPSSTSTHETLLILFFLESINRPPARTTTTTRTTMPKPPQTPRRIQPTPQTKRKKKASKPSMPCKRS